MSKLPEGWEIVKFSKAVKLRHGHQFRKYDFVENGIPVIKIGQCKIDGSLDLSNCDFVSEERFQEFQEYQIKKGDLLMALTGGTLGKVTYVDKDYGQVLQNYRVGNFLPYKEFATKSFVRYILLSDIFQSLVRSKVNQGAQPNIGKEHIDNMLIPLPPLPEQKRIVSKLDTLFERLDQSISLLEENIKHTEALMASALDEVFSNIKAKKDFLETCCEKIQYGYTGKTLENGKYYYLRITDIQDGIVDFSKTPFSDISEKDVNKYRLSKGDILFARTGATAGKSYLFESNNSSVFASYLIRVVCNRDVLKPGFLYWYFQSGDYWKQIFAGVTGAAQPNFNGKKLGNLIIPIPEKIIQEKVISKVKTVHAAMVKVQTERKEKLNHLKSLKNSILDKAFKGEL